MAANVATDRGTATPEEIWAILRETAQQHKEHERWRKEQERRQAEADEKRERERAEADERRERERAEADERREREKAEADERQDIEWAKIKERWDEACRQLSSANRKTSSFINAFGEIYEHLVAPAIEERLGELGFIFNQVSQRSKFYDASGKPLAEIDLLLENNDVIVVVGVTENPSDDFIMEQEKKSETLREFFRGKNDERRILGAVAGAAFGTEQRRAALKAGLFVIVQAGDTMRMDIPDGFKPREW